MIESFCVLLSVLSAEIIDKSSGKPPHLHQSSTEHVRFLRFEETSHKNADMCLYTYIRIYLSCGQREVCSFLVLFPFCFEEEVGISYRLNSNAETIHRRVEDPTRREGPFQSSFCRDPGDERCTKERGSESRFWGVFRVCFLGVSVFTAN